MVLYLLQTTHGIWSLSFSRCIDSHVSPQFRSSWPLGSIPTLLHSTVERGVMANSHSPAHSQEVLLPKQGLLQYVSAPGCTNSPGLSRHLLQLHIVHCKLPDWLTATHDIELRSRPHHGIVKTVSASVCIGSCELNTSYAMVIDQKPEVLVQGTYPL